MITMEKRVLGVEPLWDVVASRAIICSWLAGKLALLAWAHRLSPFSRHVPYCASRTQMKLSIEVSGVGVGTSSRRIGWILP